MSGSQTPLDGAGLPDSLFTWRFDAASGDSWGGTLVADSVAFAPGSAFAGQAGTYTILFEDERGEDLSALGLEDGQVFVEWYFARVAGGFLPTRNGPGLASGLAGLGSELDFAWTGAEWAAFGLGGRFQVDGPPRLADARFDFVFQADSGDRWTGVLFDAAALWAPGNTLRTDFGTYTITAEAAIVGDGPPAATVRLVGTYYDAVGGRALAVTGANGLTDHGTGGLGSELAPVFNEREWVTIGLGGALQADTPPELRPLLPAFGLVAGGWESQDRYPRVLADVNGDGRADIVGFGAEGVLVSLAAGGGFAPAYVASREFGFLPSAGGWGSQAVFPRAVADVNGDGRADIVGFGAEGVLVSLAAGGGFAPAYVASREFGFLPSAGGWGSQAVFPRAVADVNGDGRADIVGFGAEGVLVSLAAGGGFAPAYVASREFGFLPSAGGWGSQAVFPRAVADVNGDGRADIVGFGAEGVLVSLAAGGGFAPAYVASREFGFLPSAGGWGSQAVFPRSVADVNGDGRADIVGFGAEGVLVSLAAGGGFAPAYVASREFGFLPSAGGWGSQEVFPRSVADVNGDGRADIVGFGSAGVYSSGLLLFD